MTMMCIDVSLPPRVDVISGFQLFPINLIGKHLHLKLKNEIEEEMKENEHI